MTRPDTARRRRTLRLVISIGLLTAAAAVAGVVAGPIHPASGPGLVARTQHQAHPATSPDSVPQPSADVTAPPAAAAAVVSALPSATPAPSPSQPSDSPTQVTSPVSPTPSPGPTPSPAPTLTPTPPPVPAPTMLESTACGCAQAPDGDTWTQAGYELPTTFTVTDPAGATTTLTVPAIPDAGAVNISGSEAFDSQGDLWVSMTWTTSGTTVDGNTPFYDHTTFDRLSPQGQVTQFTVPGADPDVSSLVSGPDGAIWFTAMQDVPDQSDDGSVAYTQSYAIGRVTADGLFTSYPTEIGGYEMVASGNAVWFLATTSQRSDGSRWTGQSPT